MNNAAVRIATGIIFLFVVFGALFSGQLGVVLLYAAIAGLCLWEFLGLLFQGKEFSRRRWIGQIGGLVPFALMVGHLYDANTFGIEVVILGSLSIIFLTLLVELLSNAHQSFYNIAFVIVGLVYVVLPFALALWVYDIYGVQVIAGLMILVIVNDSLAYFFGKVLGRTPFFPHISPKKTWEGTFGGLTMAIAASIILSFYYTDLSIYNWVALAIISVVFGTSGDLIESMLKRGLKVKDSSGIMPGHGGLLDRFDGFIFIMPFATLYLIIFA